MECTPRGGGNRLAEVLRYATGVDLIKAAVLAAVGESIIDIEQKPYNGYWAEIILHSDEPGVFGRLWIDDSIQKNVFEIDIWVKPGDFVEGFGAANHAIGTLILRFDNERDMLCIVEHIKQHIKILLLK